MADKKVVVYSTPTCPWCKKAKEYLTQKGIAYTDINVATDRNAAKEMIKKSGQMSVPVIMVDDEIVVGFNQPQLDKLLAK
jgi:glutaredoxin-like YruB-family protein